MEILSLFQASVLTHLQSGASPKLAYELAAFDAIGLPDVRRAMIEQDVSPEKALRALIERVEKGFLPEELGSLNFVVHDPGPLVTLPKTDCLKLHLPEHPTAEDYRNARSKCASA